MRLVEIEGQFNMNTGTPLPFVMAVDGQLTVIFWERVFNVDKQEDGYLRDRRMIKIKFKWASTHSFGTPNEEALDGHRYYALGLKPYAFYELLNSDLIVDLSKIGRFHPRYNPNAYEGSHHYIITFHDSTFECVADSFEIFRYNQQYDEVAQNTLNEFLK